MFCLCQGFKDLYIYLRIADSTRQDNDQTHRLKGFQRVRWGDGLYGVICLNYLPKHAWLTPTSPKKAQLLQEFPRTRRIYDWRFSRKNHYRQRTESKECFIYISHLAVGIPQSPAKFDLSAFCNKLPSYSW